LRRNRAVDFVEICNVCARKAIIKVAKRKINDKICHSYIDLNFGVTFLEHSVLIFVHIKCEVLKMSDFVFDICNCVKTHDN